MRFDYGAADRQAHAGSLRFCREEGVENLVCLTIKSGLGEDGQLLISVSDTGVGLPAEKVHRQ
jgi:signal transduction histidine kinase